MPLTVTSVHLKVLQISPKTRWTLVEICASNGQRGFGEATLNSQEHLIAKEFVPMAQILISAPIDASLHAFLPPARGLPHAAARAALDQALWDLRGKAEGCASAQLLGGMHRQEIDLYANINRRTTDRSATSFVQSAHAALARGFTRLKIAPFDEVRVDSPTPERIASARAGIERVYAVRDAIGPQMQLMVDCHWRFDEASAREMIAALAAARPWWVECPVPEPVSAIEELVRLRARANASGIRLAGNELGIGLQGFRPYLEAGAYDVMMPDVKYVGSLREIVEMAEHFQRSGTELSPHNPTGPICHAASLQVCAALPQTPLLEMQFDESEWFDRLVSPAIEAPRGGRAGVPQQGGFGVDLVDAPASMVVAAWDWGPNGQYTASELAS